MTKDAKECGNMQKLAKACVQKYGKHSKLLKEKKEKKKDKKKT